ncbi:MAG: hypothetical protein ACKVJP_10205 [Flavobacteriales bacterium]|jgi:hypothetical protein|tara:strand:- start:940 stop:1335 length:396 start_codon:yes stop_codon:yes gene_type:complete
MKYFTILFCVFVVWISLGSCKEKTCKDFQVGTFKSLDERMPDITIYRNDSTQTEINTKLGTENIFNITWVNDCEYYLVLKETKTPDKNLLNELDTLRVSITLIEDDNYQFTAFLKGKKFVNDIKQINNTPK